MAPSPLISVLMPVYDAGATLPACLASLRRQRHVSWECVAVDDGSRDESRELLRAAAALDPRIRVLERPHAGIVASLTAGLAECRGEYVARMDADDVMHRDRLALQSAALTEDRSLAGVGCHVRIFPKQRATAGRGEYQRWLNSLASAADVRRDAFIECPLAHPTLMVRRAALQSFGYRDQGWPEDYDLVLRLLGAGHELGVVPRRLLAWRDGASRLSRTSAAYAIARFTECKAHFLAGSFLGRTARYVLWGYGDTGRGLSRALLEHGKRPSAIVELHPGRLGQRILGAKVIAPSELGAVLSAEPQPVVASVARAGPRSEVRAALAGLGLVELRDYVCAA